MVASGALATLLQQARRRYFWILTLSQSAAAASAALGLFLLLLILGTQVLDWYWPVLLLAGGLAFVAIRVYRALPSSYRLAQLIDSHTGLPDLLSTAFYFGSHSQRADSQTMELQRRQAEGALAQVHLARVFPLAMPRAAYSTLALAVIAMMLLGMRYRIIGTLDLHQPLIALDLPLLASKFEEAVNKSQPTKVGNDKSQRFGVSLTNSSQPQQQAINPDQTPFKAITAPNPDGTSQVMGQGQKSDQMSKNPNQQSSEQQQGEGDKQGGKNGESPDEDGKESPAGAKLANDQQPQKPQDGKQGNQQPAGNSLMSKMRDAMANLMNKLQGAQKPGDTQQQANSANQNKNGNPQENSQKGAQAANSSQADKAQSGEPQEGQQGETAEKSQSGQNKSGDKSAAQTNPNAKSGVGSQDGSKDLKDAEQIAAMGKISELIGRRSANVKGEVTIEVSSGKQQLITPYQERHANHVEAGGETNRDEIPLAYQAYVQEYFEQVRKEKPGRSKPDPNQSKHGASN